MLDGTVNTEYEAVVTLTLQAKADRLRTIEAVVDTGYNGFLTLPPELITELDLTYTSLGIATLADGSAVNFEVYDATVLWDGQPRDIEVDAAHSKPLVGMLLLSQHSLYIEVQSGGVVTVRAIE